MFESFIRSTCRGSYRHPLLWMSVALVANLGAALEVRNVTLDTDLSRLLPEQSQAVRWGEELKGVMGDGGYFSLLFEGDDREALVTAVEMTAGRVQRLPFVHSVDYQRPVEFIQHYRYLLVPSDRLLEILDLVDQWQAEVSPFVVDVDPSEEGSTRQTPEDLETEIARYSHLTGFHESADGRVMGLIVRPEIGVTNLGALRELFGSLDAIVGDVSRDVGVWGGISGSLRNRIDEYDVITSDLNRSGVIAGLAIILTLALSFRSLTIVPVLMFPLLTGLLWSFALVPTLVGGLNTITSFLLLILFGMGIDYSIHLARQFQAQLLEHEPELALERTFLSSGRSVLTGGATTAFGFSALAVSDFRGFSEFGFIGAGSMLMVVLAMTIVMPATLAAGLRLGLVRPRPHQRLTGTRWLYSIPAACGVAALVLGSAALAVGWMSFDYDFTSLSADRRDSLAGDRHRSVYSGFSAPAAVYVARDVDILDRSLSVFALAKEAEEQSGLSTIGRLTSIRDLAPDDAELRERRELILELQESVEGRWTERIEDPEKQRWITDIRSFVPPDQPLDASDVPAELQRGLVAQDGSGEFLLGVNTAGSSRDGKMSMAFTEALYAIQLPLGARGPTGDKPVLAEILWLVLGEGPWLVGLAFLAVLLVVLLDRRSLTQSFWIMLPLVAGVILTLGATVALGWKLNFLNIVVLPALIGVGVDDGVHYYRRWHELGCDSGRTYREMFEPLTVTTLTTIMGYSGLTFAHHPGLRSIGSLAVVGLVCTWLTALVLLPGLLSWRYRSR